MPIKVAKTKFSREEALRDAPDNLKETFRGLFEQIDRLDLTLNYYDMKTGKREKEPREELLRRICKEAQHVEHSGYKLVGTIPFRDNEGKIDKSKQDYVDGYYVFKNTDTPDKILDILKISSKFGMGKV